MTSKRIVYTRPDGCLSVVVPSLRAVGDHEVAALDVLLVTDVPAVATSVSIVDVSELPTSRVFRDAWEHQGRAVAVNMAKAREIHMGRIRVSRDRALVHLDIAFQRALEADDKTQQREVAGQKQTLRDLPQTFALSGAETPEALEALWPAGLERGEGT